ncbi:uncharacterized protein LOC105632818 isoform X2 [Jatropha curcas]|uniref:uncharacterized protein LOC105632818 isoform X2 n=1 Tax=Jatropha curcas TaxID=180498 RepID=UPI0009D6757E|nr:uncharacterized protein LOC105632818 isoform X2 [Jatropha curcas]
MVLEKKKDHWAFLEEIEAPTWVDLTLEAKSTYQEIDDGWFHTTHVFHQCSSQELKAAFAHVGEGFMSSDIYMKAPSSPKLPSSVSRSRGKHYESNKSQDDNNLSLNKQHPVKVLSGKPSRAHSGSGEEIKPKLSFMNSKGISRSKRSFVLGKNLTEVKDNNFKAVSSYGHSEGSSSSAADKSGESNTSTVTSEGDQKPQRTNLEVSSQALGYSSGLLSAMRISLRKSYTTRQASRVDLNNKRQSRGRNSVSSKSSVGSSSNSNHGNGVKSSTFALIQQYREWTPDSRNVGRLNRATKNKVKDSIVSNASYVKVKEGICNSRKGGTSIVAKSSHQELPKSKVQKQTLHAKGLLPHKVNEQGLLRGTAMAKEKVTVGGPNKLVGAGNENATGRQAVSQKYSRGDIATGVMVRGQKGANEYIPEKGDKTRSVVLKIGVKMGSKQIDKLNGRKYQLSKES